jgi:hypothetical protein
MSMEHLMDYGLTGYAKSSKNMPSCVGFSGAGEALRAHTHLLSCVKYVFRVATPECVVENMFFCVFYGGFFQFQH